MKWKIYIHSLFWKPDIQIVVEYVYIKFFKIALVLRKLKSCVCESAYYRNYISSIEIFKIYDFEYVTYTCPRFVNTWHTEIVFNINDKKFLCFRLRNCIILWYRDFFTKWKNSKNSFILGSYFFACLC